MSDEFDLLDDDEQTLALDEDEIEINDDEDDLADDEMDDDDFDDEDEDLPPPEYSPSSNVYTLFLVIACVAYIGAIAITFMELKDYCADEQFLFGLFAGK